MTSDSIPWSVSSPLRLTASPLSTSSLTPDHCSSPASEPLSDMAEPLSESDEDEGSLCIDIDDSTEQVSYLYVYGDKLSWYQYIIL